jgi:hypothetical protein
MIQITSEIALITFYVEAILGLIMAVRNAPVVSFSDDDPFCRLCGRRE